MQTSAKEMLDQVARDLKSRGLTHTDVARDLNYKMRQTVGAILASDKYMNRAQAKRFSDKYGYYYNFLISGEGSLMGPTEEPGTTFYLPQHALLLRPFESQEAFNKAFDSFIRSMIAAYDANEIQRFLNETVQYIGLVNDPVGTYRNKPFSPDDPRWVWDTKLPNTPDYINRAIEDIRHSILGRIFTTYNDMVNKK
ncbi:MAG: hypothetical protein II676_00445 [Bacteroidales bacterium]|nr:hypothetical protein [Bacteroidales bacterium]